ncbi:MAG: DUF4328 domain-containing protein [Bacteroidota bacterium]
MNTELDICKQCTKREMNFTQGIVCSLTHEKPVFEDDCAHFEKDESVEEREQFVKKTYKPKELKPNTQRAKTAMTLISIVLGLEIVSLVSSGMQYSLLQTLSQGRPVTNAVAEANDLREQTIAIVYMTVYIISGITFIRWFRRAYYNLHQKVTRLSNSEGWAAGSWFVPIVSLYMPYQIMKELYEETKNYISTHGLKNVLLATRFLGLWWALWIGSNIFGQVIYHMSKGAASLTQLANVTILSIIGSVIGIVLAIVTIRVIKNYADAEGVLFEQAEMLSITE